MQASISASSQPRPRAPGAAHVSAAGRLVARRLLRAFFGGRGERTTRAYLGDLRSFRSFLEASSVEEAVSQLLRANHGRLNALVLEYRAHLRGRQLSAATVNRRLATIRSLVRRARLLGMTRWTLEVASLKAEPYRDTRGPSRAGVERMLALARARQDAKGRRDLAILHLLFDLALRRQEVVSLDLQHLDLVNRTVSVLGKGRSQRVRLTLPEQTRSALIQWIRARGTHAGPLFIGLDGRNRVDPGAEGARLTGRSVYRMVRRVGQRAGLSVTPHGLRHAAITAALDLTGGDVRAVQRFSRHRDIRVLNLYDDSRADLAGRVAALVASGRASGKAKRAVSCSCHVRGSI